MKRKGLIGAVAGVAAAGVAAAVAAERFAVGRIRLRPDPEAGEPLGALRGSPRSVTAPDGTELYVEVDEPETAPAAGEPTVVFCHGYALNLDSWHYQRRALREQGLRLVFWDQRDHGRSGRTEDDTVDIDRLGADLVTVLDAVVPKGPVVLVGHSMGGMTVMALAAARPDLFAGRGPSAPRVVAVALVGTSSGRLDEVRLGLPMVVGKVFQSTAGPVLRALGRTPGLVERGRSAGGDLAFLLTRRFGFGDPSVSPTVVDFLEQMIRSTPIETIARFWPALMAHDKLEVLEQRLSAVPTVIICGERDLITPIEHSEAMSAALPGAEFVRVSDAGHIVLMERPDLVNEALVRLIDSARRPSRRFRLWRSA
ncbi:MAG: alpha/beta fold hydrolase [Streptosporangiales bacterium]|nr:alpha/beta fold hydrolase [Streptosporangiales bacterium]